MQILIESLKQSPIHEYGEYIFHYRKTLVEFFLIWFKALSNFGFPNMQIFFQHTPF